MDYTEDQIFRQEPDCYDGDNCDEQRPRWMTSYPKEGDEEVGEILELRIPARSMPPGSRIIIEVPTCPQCTERADMNGCEWGHREWPDCDCGFSWKEWAFNEYC